MYVPVPNRPLVQLRIMKSSEKTTYTRSFNKVDEYLSYVGGLIGTIIGFMFIMEKYNEKAYEISLSTRLLRDDSGENIPSSHFHLGYYLLCLVKEILDFFGCKPNWKKTQVFLESSEEMSSQLDVAYLMRKLLFMDAAISKLMEKHEVEALCVREKPTIEKVKEERKKHFAYEIIVQNERKNDEKREEFPNLSF